MLPRIVIALAIIVGLASVSMFRVYEQERAILFQLGKIQRSDFTPGLYFKVPVYQNVEKFDIRLQTLDSEPQRFLTGEKKDVIVDSFVRYRVNDIEKYYISTGGDARRAGILLYQKINDGLRSEFGKRTVQEVVSGERGAIMNIVTKTADDRGEELGMEIVDVRLKRIDLPAEVSQNVYERMRSERARVAREFRARGEKTAITIKADADRSRTVVGANAYRDAETLRGTGDAGAAKIYADAYNKNREFYDFYRSLNAYKTSFRSGGDVFLLDPESDFFKYFTNPGVQ
ncbi:MAG: membrane protease subunit HflC [Gammaproteobacteria bacterium]|jgi:membrane protease subunit HflC